MGQHDRRGGGDQLVYGETPTGNEAPLLVTDDGKPYVYDVATMVELLTGIARAMQTMNLHLAALTGEQFGRSE